MAWIRKLTLFAGATAAGAALAQPAGQKTTGPIATYWVSAQTQSGLGMPAMGAGAPDRTAMMRMAMGGGGAQHLLTLQLGSSQRPQGAPSAEHLPPPNLGAGDALPLITPVAQPAQPVEERPAMPQTQQPRGRMLFFWGCGEHARAGQPVVVDFSQMAAGKVPQQLAAINRGLSVTPQQPPAPGRNATYGEWPNERARSAVPPQGSLAGEHVVRGNYSPEIRFTLAQNQDFLAPLTLTTNARTPAGAVQLAWNAVPNAKGYFASVVGGGQDTVVMWSSSEVQSSAFGAPDYLTPADAARLVTARQLLSPQTTSCQVPKEVLDAAPQAMLQMVAYGPEANFVYPPRPPDPKMAWNRQWAVKVRYRSATGGLLGMPLPSETASDEDRGRAPPRRGAPPPPPPQEDRRRSILRGLGGALGVPGVPGF